MGLSFYALGFGQAAGTTNFNFLKDNYSARGAGMANNLLAIKGDVNALFYNPAALSGILGRQWTVNYVDHLLDFQGGQLIYSQPNRLLGNVSLGLLYLNYGDFQETNQFGDETGRNFGASEFALAVSVANELGQGFDYGLTVKYVYSSLDNFNASALAFDAGLIYTLDYLDNLQLGISVSNLGLILSHFTDVREKMPLNVRFGLAKRLAHLPLLFTLSLNDISQDSNDLTDVLKRFSMGGEFDVSEKVKLRLGYDNAVNRSVKPVGTNGFGGFTAGLGIHYHKIRFDYAYASYGDLGSQNRLGVTGSF